MVILYTMSGNGLLYPVKFTHPVKFTYSVNVQELTRALILGLAYTTIFPYLVKYSVHKSTYFLENNNNNLKKHKV